jgi:hypothetical protein
MFVDMPWVLAPDTNAAKWQTILRESWPNEIKKYKRLYAFGADAYALVRQLQQSTQLQWEGQTGRLSINQLGEIHRDQLRWARFVDGKPQLLD